MREWHKNLLRRFREIWSKYYWSTQSLKRLPQMLFIDEFSKTLYIHDQLNSTHRTNMGENIVNIGEYIIGET